MKKRIISLILVVALSVLVLAGCGYSYQKDDLYQYAGTDKAALSAALAAKFKSLTIDDGEFGHVESERQEYLVDEIYERIAAAFASDKKTTGVPDGKDNVYYCYYATVVNTDKDGNVTGENIIYANKMAYNATATTTGATAIVLGNEDAKGLEKLIASALAGIDIKDYAYTTDTSATLAAGDKIYISYTKSVPKINDNNEVVSGQYDKITVSYGTLEIPKSEVKDETTEGGNEPKATDTAAKKSFAEQLIGKKAGSSKLTGTFEAYETVKGLPDQKVTYSDVTVHFVVKGGAPISFEYTYNKDTLGDDYKKTASEKDIYGESIKLDGKKINYNVFPVYYIDVNLDATSIIKGMFKDTKNYVSTFDADTFECIKALCDSNSTISTLVNGSSGLVALLDKYSAKDSKAADSAAVDSQIKFILEKAAEAGVADLEDKIIAEYKEMVYDELDAAYDSEIKADLLIAIYNAIKEVIKLDLRNDEGWYKLPEDAVEDAYDMYIDMYEFNFYEGLAEGSNTSTTEDDVRNYDKYQGNFNNYLRATLGLKADAPEQAIYDQIGAQAEEDVRQRIRIHLVADCLGITVNDDEIEDFKYNNVGFQSLISSGREPSDEDVITAMLATKVYDHLLAVDESKTGDDNNLQPVFFNITYSFKVEEEEEESKDETEDTTEGDTKEESDK